MSSTAITSWFSQSAFDVRFEWGLEGARHLSSQVDITIVVDVLSFSTCVDVGLSKGAHIYPFLYKDNRLEEYAHSIGAKCAQPKRSKTELCLSPQSLMKLSHGDKLVLPSPNGSSICFSVQSPKILCGCLRNAEAIANYTNKTANKILVVAAGEKWKSDNSLRPAFEDLLGAGAILSQLRGTKSPEALAAIQTFNFFQNNLNHVIANCSSGQELMACGFPEDVEMASELNVSKIVPILSEGYFRNGE